MAEPELHWKGVHKPSLGVEQRLTNLPCHDLGTQVSNGEGNLDLGQQNFLDFPRHNWDNDEGVQNTDLVNWFVSSGHKLYTDPTMRFLGAQFIPVGLP